jgi:hypothetical protein
MFVVGPDVLGLYLCIAALSVGLEKMFSAILFSRPNSELSMKSTRNF